MPGHHIVHFDLRLANDEARVVDPQSDALGLPPCGTGALKRILRISVGVGDVAGDAD